VIDTIRRHRPTIFAGVPKIYNAMIKSLQDLKNLGIRICLSAGEPLPPNLDESWEKLTDTQIFDVYGLTEIHCLALCNLPGDKKIGTSGKPMPGIQCKLINEHGVECQIGEIGQLMVQSPSQAIGYYNDPLATSQVFQDDWISTGDRFIKDKQGFYHFVGRVNDMFKIDAKWVSPIEIENVLLQTDFISEAAVTYKKDHGGLHKILAVVVPVTNKSLPSDWQKILKNKCLENLDRYKIPKVFDIRGELPRNANGKLVRNLI
jgi:benzoate-CoA ligase